MALPARVPIERAADLVKASTSESPRDDRVLDRGAVLRGRDVTSSSRVWMGPGG